MNARTRDALAFLAEGLHAFGLILLAFLFWTAIHIPGRELVAYAGSGGPYRLIAAVVAVISVLVLFAATVHVARRKTPFPVKPFLALTVLASLLFKAALIAWVNPDWSGDFLRYWNMAITMGEQRALEIGTSIYKQRAALVFYPVYRIFGDSHLALKVINGLGLLTTFLLAYDVMRIARNHQAAQAFAVLLLFCPLPALAALFPSHDLWGAFFVAGVVWSITRASYVPSTASGWIRTAAFAVLASVLVALLEVQRGAASMMPLAIVITAALCALASAAREDTDKWRVQPSRAVIAALMVIALLGPLLYATERVGLKKPLSVDNARATTYMKLAAHGGVFSNSRSPSWVRFDERFNEKRRQGAAAVADFGKSIVLSSWAEPDNRKLRKMRNDAPRLFQLGYPPDWNVVLKSPRGMSPAVRSAAIAYINAFGLLTAIAMSLSLAICAVSTRRTPFPITALLFFTLLLAGSLLAFFENKPPNLYSTWLAVPMFLSWFASNYSGDNRHLTTKRSAFTCLAGIVLAIALYLSARAVLDLFYSDAHGRIITNWTVVQQPLGKRPVRADPVLVERPRAFDPQAYSRDGVKDWVRRDAAGDSKRMAKYASGFFTALELPLPIRKGDRASMSRRICAGPRRGSLELFLYSGYRRTGRPRSFALEVSTQDIVRKRVWIPLAERSMQLVVVPGLFQVDACQDVQLSLISNVDSRALSWQRASHVEVWIPRMVE